LSFEYTRCAQSGARFLRRDGLSRHLHNFGLFGVEAHGLWTAKADEAHRAFVLVSYAEGDDPGEAAQRYIQSPEAADNARDFDVADILGVESTILVPSASSPLK
jgi:hypothetical protein